MAPSLGFLACLLLVALATELCSCQGQEDSRNGLRPHIVLILADDLGWSDVGWRDNALYTPTIDRLAREGMVLNDSYMQPTCSPSRAALMTGRYPFRLGLQHSVLNAGMDNYLSDNYTLLPEYLRRLGYATHMIGKWHLGFCNWKYTPTHRGFDTFYGYYNGIEGYYNHTGNKNGYDFRDNEEVDWSAKGQYSTHLFATRAQRILRSHDRSRPLFLYLSFQAVHGPFEVPEWYIENYCAHVPDAQRRVRCGMIAALDEAICNVTGVLEEEGYLNNTLILFSSDNGGPTNKASSNWPLRGSKTTLWEGGTRSVGFIHSRTLLRRSGRTYSGLIHAVDWLPTLLAVAGSDGNDLPDDIDGMNLWQHIKIGTRSPRMEFVYNIDDVNENAALRMGRFKVISGNPGRPNDWPFPPAGARPRAPVPGRAPDVQLFDLDVDPAETRNIADRRPQTVANMLQKLQRYKRGLVATRPGRVMRRSDPKFHNNTWSPGFC